MGSAIIKWPFDTSMSEIFRYDHGSGHIFWMYRPRHMFPSDSSYKTWNKRFSGKEANARVNKNGYKQATVMGKTMTIHRLVWMYHNDGHAPESIDHINCNKLDNRIENLRPATTQENGFNRPKNKNNTSGYKGVSLNKKLGKWRAVVYFNGKAVYAGHHVTAEDAHKAYCEKLKSISGDFYHA